MRYHVELETGVSGIQMGKLYPVDRHCVLTDDDGDARGSCTWKDASGYLVEL